MRVELVNENSVIIYFSDAATPGTMALIAAACTLLQSELADCLSDMTPSYTSILLSSKPEKVRLKEFAHRITQLLTPVENQGQSQLAGREIVLPVYYGEEVALDHVEISQHSGLPFAEVVKLHLSEIYRVFAIGFTPGFAYLGHVPETIATPRKANPRAQVPKGSVAIADRQTAVYPTQSPGGWQIIGRTPIELFNPQKSSLSYFEVGDSVRFKAIDRATFIEMGGEL